MTLLEHPIGGVADRFLTGCCDIDGGMFAAIDITHGSVRIESRPGIPHADGEAVKVARLRRGVGCIDANRSQSAFIPHPSDAVGSGGANIEVRSAEKHRYAGATKKREAMGSRQGM